MGAQACPTDKARKLLIATDGSQSCDSAEREAIKLAKICSSRLLALSVVVTNREYEEVLPWVVERAEREMREHLESFRSLASQEGVDCEAILHQGEDPYVDIIDEAAKSGADLIVMGTHARTGIKRLIMGRLTARVIGHSPCNILVVPPGSGVNYGHILLASDGSKHSAAASAEAITIAKQCNSTLMIVTVIPSDAMPAELLAAESNVNQLAESANKEGVKHEALVIRGKPHEAIVNTAAEKRADLIVLGSHGLTGLMSLLMGSVTGQVISHTHSAVLVVKMSQH
jgi:nucleotide-binding universal stress UspA family protein